MDSGFQITEVVSGGQRGVDAMGEIWAESKNIPVHVEEADWILYGRAAGPIRNRKMAEYADALIAVWDGHSRGSLSMIQEATRTGLKIHEHII